MQRTPRLGWLRTVGRLALALSAAVALHACASEDDGASGANEWVFGGQTGSLMPLCGVTPGALMRGVPASAAGIVVDPRTCTGSALSELAVRDARGQDVPFSVTPLPDGTLLVSFAGGLTPGGYVVGVATQFEGDEDGGVDNLPEPPIDMQPVMQQVLVQEPLPLPTAFGEAARVGGECGAVLELTPDPSVLPYLGVLSVDLQIDFGATKTIVPVGTLELMGGTARINLLEHGLQELWTGEHELRVTVRIAGESMPLETFLLTAQVPCSQQESYDEGNSGGMLCATHAGRGSRAPIVPLVAIALYALRRRRRRARG